ncbi:MAG: glycosyltransferase, partial [Lachnospiraceae bacterium]|nr:glycosyltransferase [Lachnospiraceae bacterium]
MNSLEQAGQEQGRQPDISVVVPAYSAERFLARAVDSIRRQTTKNIEILLVDDGSTDGTAALCHSLEAEDSRIRVLTRQNGGAAAARNPGIRAAAGRYVCFV